VRVCCRCRGCFLCRCVLCACDLLIVLPMHPDSLGIGLKPLRVNPEHVQYDADSSLFNMYMYIYVSWFPRPPVEPSPG